MLSSTRLLQPELPSSSRVSAGGLWRVSGSRRPRQPADRPLRQNTVKGMDMWRARCNTPEHRHKGEGRKYQHSWRRESRIYSLN